MAIEITAHAVRRFCERVRRTKQGRAEIRQCIIGAHQKLLRKAIAGAETDVPTGCCVLVCKDAKIVTINPITPNLVPTRKDSRRPHKKVQSDPRHLRKS